MTPSPNPFPTYSDPRAGSYGPPATPGDAPAGPPRDPGSPGLAILSWVAIVALIGLVLFLHQAAPPPSPAAATIPPPSATLTLMGRYTVGANSVGGSTEAQRALLVGQLDKIAGDDFPDDRLRVAIVAGELLDADAARERIDAILAEHPLAPPATPDAAPDLIPDLDAPVPITPELASDIDLVRSIFGGGDVNRDPAAHADFIERHRWFGELALSQEQANTEPLRASVLARGQRTTGVMVAIVFLAIGAAVVGFIVSIFAVAMLAKGRLRPAYAPPAPGGSVYLETFALFLAVFMVVNILAAFIEQRTGQDFTAYLIWFVPVAALYPLMRGVPWSQHRYAIGWHKGRGVFRELGAAVMGYLAGLPIVAAGIGLTLLLMTLWGMIAGAEEGGPPTHPVMDRVGTGGIMGLLSIYLLASVWAPLTEESLFRGALYHHLRGRLRPFFSALIVGLIFAVIHPQGFLAIPALASLGFVFSLMREWRGSIIAPMVAHGLHNGTVVTALWLALS